MQSINLISKVNDLEAVRQLVNAGRGEILSSYAGILIPNELLDGKKAEKLTKAGFKIIEIGSNYTTVN